MNLWRRTLTFQAVSGLMWLAWAVGCSRSSEKASPLQLTDLETETAVDSITTTVALSVSRFAPRPAQLAFNRHRWAVLEEDELVVRRVGYAGVFARVPLRGAHTVVSLLGGGFLAEDSSHLYRLSARDKLPKVFPHWSQSGQALLLPHPAHSEEITVYRPGYVQLAQYDLGEVTGDKLPAAGVWQLVGFDGRAVVGLASSRLVYTVAGGIARQSEGGQVDIFDLPQIEGEIASLLRTDTSAEVWAVTERKVYRIALREDGEILRQIDTSPSVVAVHAEGNKLAFLSLQEERAGVRHMRLDVHGPKRNKHWVVQLAEPVGESGRGGSKNIPELRLAPWNHLVAVVGNSTQIFNWRKGTRVYPMPQGNSVGAVKGN